MTQKSKFISYVLRHKPDAIGLTLDAQGWADVPALLQKAEAHGTALSLEELKAIVRNDQKSRFSLSQDGQRIRAAQGHSVDVCLGLEPVEPPDQLYHGTALNKLSILRAEGLKPMSRRQVHLSADEATARQVGTRHGKPHVLHVDAARMQADGFAFYQADNGVWLTDHVPPEYLSGWPN
ncbi:RNA 2'-phosphotransferase [Pelagimonas phthalicica]|nr:RNA 2'-phosphotransferase [Pelagimonas phthalicica]